MKPKEADNPEEILDVVNEHDIVIGQKSRGDIYKENLPNFRAVSIFLINGRGELWIPRRAAHKKLYPLHLDMSAAGHVAAGKTYLEAAQKELREELNIDPDTVTLHDLGYLSPSEGVGVGHIHTYVLHQDDTPDYNTDDFVEYYWLSPAEILEKIKNGDKAKNHLPMLIETYFM